MSTHVATASSSLPPPPAANAAAPAGAMPVPASAAAGRALVIGAAGLIATAVGLVFSTAKTVAFSYLVGITFWTGLALGMLFLVMIHHIFDASWSTVLRRQYEHGLAAFKWLGLLFVPLVVTIFINPSLIWKWMDPAYDLSKVGGHGTVGSDILWIKKSGLLSPQFFLVATIASFLIWMWLSARLRRASFTQDADGDIKWTFTNRKTAAFGLPLAAITLTLCVILWVKSLDYHWFSTMYGVWYFAGCVRAALSAGVIIMLWLWQRGDYKGILNDNHLHSIGQLMFAFTVFWAYVTFSQYFLIWNANVPEETFWYNIRELNPSNNAPNQWKWVGMFLLFGHFFFPFFALISYPAKICKGWMKFMSFFIAFAFLIDVIYNILPSKKIVSAGIEGGNPYPFIGDGLIWVVTSVIGIGGVCVWAYLRSFPTAKLIPIRDPRIGECLTHH
ncbi:hypothetical protein OpiT1DRAFT_05248 [Opitutaceae bacterium TAV1]|nr:hypothetical protein OpiT1DRAFT_05248 [Opitutaceae bacterium TAV1]